MNGSRNHSRVLAVSFKSHLTVASTGSKAHAPGHMRSHKQQPCEHVHREHDSCLELQSNNKPLKELQKQPWLTLSCGLFNEHGSLVKLCSPPSNPFTLFLSAPSLPTWHAHLALPVGTGRKWMHTLTGSIHLKPKHKQSVDQPSFKPLHQPSN